ncbi:MAG: hypothetical protein MRZ32_02470, partial [Bacteroidales bacterium]|nr:hypothetical protein [Bacteroidales bacterium]
LTESDGTVCPSFCTFVKYGHGHDDAAGPVSRFLPIIIKARMKFLVRIVAAVMAGMMCWACSSDGTELPPALRL